jgi:hypothetical protein
MEALRNRIDRQAIPLLFVVALIELASPSSAIAGDDAKSETRLAQVQQEPTTLAKIDDLPLPDAEELLRSRPFDWIVLKSREVLVVEPLTMRPDMIAELAIRHEMAIQTYNRILKHKPYQDAELASSRQYDKNGDRADELNAREASIKQELDRSRERVEALKPATYKFPITLRDDSIEPEYMLDLRHVESITYYEDLVLRRADLLIAEGRTPLAYDLLMLVARRYRTSSARIQAYLEAEEQALVARIQSLEDERIALRKSRTELGTAANRTSSIAKMRLTAVEKTIVAIAVEIRDLEIDLKNQRYKLRFMRPRDFPNPDPPRKDDLLLPAWPRYDEVYRRLVYKDSDEQFNRGLIEEALRLLDEIWKPGPEIPELASRMGLASDRLITESVDRTDYRQARHFLAKLAARFPTHPVVAKWRADLEARALTGLQSAVAKSAEGDVAAASRTAEIAARIWPDAAGLREKHRELTDRYQILKVGVLELAEVGSRSRLPTVADERERWLTESRLFEPIGISEHGVQYRSSFFESWEPTDLGRQVHFRLKLKRADWEARTLITSADVHAELTSRIDPDSADFNERIAGFVNGITVQSPAEFTIMYRQPPLRHEALWQLTVAIGAATRSLNEDIAAIDTQDLGRFRFQRTAGDGHQSTYRRVRNQPTRTVQRRVEEVVETRYESWDRLLQALLRGDVSVIPVANLRDVKGLENDGRFTIVKHALPRTHILMFNPRNQALSNGQFRRALLHGISRDRLLADVVLRDVPGSHARLVTCPFARNSYGYNRQLASPKYDPSLAAALAMTAKKQLDDSLPELRMVCPADPKLRDVARAMIEQWQRVGVQVKLLDDPVASDWDICYRTATCIEPLTDIWPLLTMEDSARVDALQSLPEPTRRILLELERAIDWTSATTLLHRLLADLLIDARYIPLWEIDEFLVARKNVVGIPARPIHPYADIEQWIVQPWYPQGTP